MNTEDQRIAIAECLGWQAYHIEGCIDYALIQPDRVASLHHTFVKGRPNEGAPLSRSGLPPDYLGSLGAMHEAVSDFYDSEREEFTDILFRIVNGRGMDEEGEYGDGITSLDCFRLADATAAQRAEAFLRTRRRWVEDGEPAPTDPTLNQHP